MLSKHLNDLRTPLKILMQTIEMWLCNFIIALVNRRQIVNDGIFRIISQCYVVQYRGGLHDENIALYI